MEVTKKKVAAAIIVYSVVVFALGRYTTPEKLKIETKVVEKVVYKEKEKKKQQTHTETVITKKPNGETVTTIVSDKKTEERKNTDVASEKDSSSSKETVRGDSKVTISVLAGGDISSREIIYGASITKPVLGPLTLGAFGLSNGSCGASIGLTF